MGGVRADIGYGGGPGFDPLGVLHAGRAPIASKKMEITKILNEPLGGVDPKKWGEKLLAKLGETFIKKRQLGGGRHEKSPCQDFFVTQRVGEGPTENHAGSGDPGGGERSGGPENRDQK